MNSPRISLGRLRDRLERLAAIGREPAGGITRLPFTPTHRLAMETAAAMMREAGLAVGMDEFGILIGSLVGAEGPPAVIAGSHLDTVPKGGMFDGALGVVAAIECAQALRDAASALRHTFIAVVFPDEEGAAFGIGTLSSRCLVGEIPRGQFASLGHQDGRSLDDHLKEAAAGFAPARLPERVAAYVELHIEQGPALTRMGRAIAAVEAITGALRTAVRFTGRANHAGTTPMDARADALAAAARFVLAVRARARATAGRAVGTVGLVEAVPGAVNVVAGEATARVDLRSPEVEMLEGLRRQVEADAREIAGGEGVAVTVEPWDQSPAQMLDPRTREVILAAMTALGEDAIALPSWAGHDAGVLARYVPAGMIFVASEGGVSHSPHEQTPWNAAGLGAQALLDTVVALDAAKPEGSRLPLAYARSPLGES